MSDTIQIACAAGAVIGILTWMHYHFSVARELRMARRETSRFPMFAARDDLVMLVASGIMDETDPSWQRAYRSVTVLLNLNQRLTLWDLISKMAQHAERMTIDPEFRRQCEVLRDEDRRTEARIPEFYAVTHDIGRALRHIVLTRTSTWHRAALWFLMQLITVFSVALKSGFRTAKAVRRTLRDPSKADMRGWTAMDGC